MSQIPPTIQGPMSSPPATLRDVPGGTASLVLGIISIVLNIPVVGLILALIGLSKARAAKAMCDANPGYYQNAGVAQAGFVCSIIGICLGGLSKAVGCRYGSIVIIALFGAAAGGAGGAGP